MQAEPLSKDIYNKAKELGIEKINLAFSGGNDEGSLYVELSPYENDKDGSFSSEIEDWAWGVYDYSGAGDGTSYGDNIIYDLVKGKVSTSEWFHVVKEEATGTGKLKIEE